MSPSRTFGGVTRYRWFESGSLQGRVCEPSVPRSSRCRSWRPTIRVTLRSPDHSADGSLTVVVYRAFRDLLCRGTLSAGGTVEGQHFRVSVPGMFYEGSRASSTAIAPITRTALPDPPPSINVIRCALTSS